MNSMLLKYEKIAENYASLLRGCFASRLTGVLLFGSVAKGKADAESDVDLICIIENLPPMHERLALKSQTEGTAFLGVESLWFTYAEFSALCQKKSPLALNALSEGRIVFDPQKKIEALKKSLFEELKQKGVIETPGAWIWRVGTLGSEIVL